MVGSQGGGFNAGFSKKQNLVGFDTALESPSIKRALAVVFF